MKHQRYKVVVLDNHHYPDRDSSVDRGNFGTSELAVAAAERAVDKWLYDALLLGVPVAELHARYEAFGVNPLIFSLGGAGDVAFNGRKYAKARCDELQATVQPEAVQ